MDRYDSIDILGNALPSASVIIDGGDPTWHDGGGISKKTINIPENKPYTHTFNISASSVLYYQGSKTEVNDMYKTMFDIGLKFHITIEKYGDGRIYLIDAVKFGNCFISCYVQKVNSEYTSWDYFSVISVNEPKKM